MARASPPAKSRILSQTAFRKGFASGSNGNCGIVVASCWLLDTSGTAAHHWAGSRTNRRANFGRGSRAFFKLEERFDPVGRAPHARVVKRREFQP